jgi:hypothetical protein
VAAPRSRGRLASDAPDYAAAIDVLKTLYADEDTMVGRLRGDGAVQTWRAQEAEGRTTVLAVAATFADEPWDDAIAW